MKTRPRHDPALLLASRRARLGRLLALDAPDIILDAEMRLVAKSQTEVYGWRWNKTPPIQNVRNWLWFRTFNLRENLRSPLRCECGHRIWWWQKRAYDPDIGRTIHATCGTPAEAGA